MHRFQFRSSKGSIRDLVGSGILKSLIRKLTLFTTDSNSQTPDEPPRKSYGLRGRQILYQKAHFLYYRSQCPNFQALGVLFPWMRRLILSRNCCRSVVLKLKDSLKKEQKVFATNSFRSKLVSFPWEYQGFDPPGRDCHDFRSEGYKSGRVNLWKNTAFFKHRVDC